ncbi:MAG: SpoIIE family protein phosphatase [Oligoflexus sp.]
MEAGQGWKIEQEECLHRSKNSEVYRVKRYNPTLSCVESFIAKHLTGSIQLNRIPGLRLKQEFELLQKIDSPYVIKAYELVSQRDQLTLLLEDFGGIDLGSYLTEMQPSLLNCLNIAIQIAKGVEHIHQARLIHKDITPYNVLVDPKDLTVRIIDFGISCELGQESQEVSAQGALEGNLFYISPEQTGRISRDLDYRTDFYSFGATLFHMFTGHPPFHAADELGLIHSHVAEVAPRIERIDPDFPVMLANIVAKLLEKEADQRYQSSFGLIKDLEYCYEQLKNTGNILPVEVGREDVSQRFCIPQRLIGRRNEIETMFRCFREVAESGKSILTVAGYSGVGKSRLINELNFPIIKANGIFVRGKFDQFTQNTPYSALSQALDYLATHILSQPERLYHAWCRDITEAVDVNGRLILEMAPKFQQILGHLPLLTELNPAESQNRLKNVIIDFLKVVATEQHPLVLFLDDMQWADSATLSFIQLIASREDLKYIMLICAYRDNEVDDGHPFSLMLKKLRDSIQLRHIHLLPLDLKSVQELIAETLYHSQNEVLGLAKIVYRKAEGNPFFTREFLTGLFHNNLIFFSRESGKWDWDEAGISSFKAAENVVEFMMDRLHRLPDRTVDAIKIASCLGNQFELVQICEVMGQKPNQIALSFEPAVADGILIPLTDHYRFYNQDASNELDLNIVYRFQHDKVQQAAYTLIPDTSREATHLQIARMLNKNAQCEQNLVELMRHYNAGVEKLDDLDEVIHVMRLNLQAVKKVKSSGAYQQAEDYLNIIHRLSEHVADFHQQYYSLAYPLMLDLIDVKFFLGKVDEAEKHAESALTFAQNSMDKARIYHLQALHYENLFEVEKGFRACFAALRSLNNNFRKKKSFLSIVFRMLAFMIRLKRLDIPSLQNRSELTDEKIILQIRIYFACIIFSYFNNHPHVAVDAMLNIMRFNLNLGNSKESAYIFAGASMISFLMNQKEKSKQFCELAERMMQGSNDPFIQSRTAYVIGTACSFWHFEPARNRHHYQMMDEFGRRSGDSMVQAIGWYMQSFDIASQDVLAGIQFIESKIPYYHKLNNHEYLLSIRIHQSFLKNQVLGESHSSGRLDIPEMSEEEVRRSLKTHTNIAMFHSHKMWLYFFDGKYEKAYHEFHNVKKYYQSIRLTLIEFSYFYFGGVAQAVYYDQADWLQKIKIRINIKWCIYKLRSWADHNPQGFQYALLILEAEYARIMRKPFLYTLSLFDRAIDAVEHLPFEQQSIVKLIAMRFVAKQNNPRLLSGYFRDVLSCWQARGSSRIVADLQETYSPLLREYWLKEHTNNRYLTKQSTHFETQMSNSVTGHDFAVELDLNTVIKMSQSLSSEVNHQELLKKLLLTLIENAGASSGSLIVRNSKDDQFYLETKIEEINQSPEVQRRPITDCQDILLDIVQYAIRTKQTKMIQDARQPDAVALRDHRQIKSISLLVVPIVYMGQVEGVIYLENRSIAYAFTPERLKIVELLASQAAVSIRNAELYRNLETKVKERTKDIQSILRNISQGILTFRTNVMLVEKDYSKHLESIIESSQIAGQHIFDVLFSQSDIDSQKIIRMERMFQKGVKAWNSEHLVKEVEIKTASDQIKILDLSWDYILNEYDEPDRIMVTVRDVSELRTLQNIEKESAQAVQKALLPDHQTVQSAEIASYYKSADSTGGDWYGCFEDKERHRIYLFIGDVTGHGMPSALVTAAVAGALKMAVTSQAAKFEVVEDFLQAIAIQVNQVVIDTGLKAGRMMTMAFLCLDLVKNQCVYLNAGHNPLIQISQAGNKIRLVGGTPLGFEGDPNFRTLVFPIAKGDAIFAYTDGLLENSGSDGKPLSLRQVMKSLSFQDSSQQLINKIAALGEQRWQGSKAEDDCTFVSIKI